MTYLDSFLELLGSLPDFFIYFLLGLSAFVENIFPPIPGDTITAFGAFLVGTKRLNFFGVYLSTTLGSLAGFMSLFWIASLFGTRFFIESDHRIFKARDISRAEDWIRKYGYYLILLNRFFPGIRSVISIAGGLSRLKGLIVALLALACCSVWNLFWIWFGYTMGSNWKTIRGKMAHVMVQYNMIALIILGLVVLFFLIRKMLKKA